MSASIQASNEDVCMSAPKPSLHIITCLLALALSSGAGSQAQERFASLPPLAHPLLSSNPARPILAWVDFCRRYERDCRVDLNEPETIRMTPQVWNLITDVNRSVNRSITSVTDIEHWGVLDRWDYATDGLGDCEDFQLLKRKRLVEAGLPRRALLMTVVLDENNEGHAVLMIRTDRGDYILDNKRDGILPWQSTTYTYIKRESQLDTSWVGLAPGSSVTTTAAR
jgi:predicted transglutaminase-like cysteine proteinase